MEIEISVSGLGVAGQVQETLPDGFSFASSDETATLVGQTVQFTVFGNEATFRYTVTAPAASGTYDFSGKVVDFNKDQRDVDGDSSIEVMDPPSGRKGPYPVPPSIPGSRSP